MAENKVALTQKDINAVMFRWFVTCEMPLNYERMQAIAYAYSLIPALKKLYTNKEDLSAALKRHMELFNTNATAGGLILGTTLAMEEQKANDPDSVSSDSIISMKTGLMGPVAAFGDAISGATISTLIGISMAREGSPVSILIALLAIAYLVGELIVLTNLTYKKGKGAIKDVLSSDLMGDIIEGANILGMAMMGALTASMVSLSVAWNPVFNEAVFYIQPRIDYMMPGFLPIATLFLYYWLISKKHVSIPKLVLFTMIAGILFAAIGLF